MPFLAGLECKSRMSLRLASPFTSKKFCAASLAVIVSLPAAIAAQKLSPAQASGKQKKAQPHRNAKSATEPKLSDRQRALHAINRLTFGARPGDVDRVLATGLDTWIEQQLQPESIDDSPLLTRLAAYRTLKMSTSQLVEAFPPQQIIRAISDGRRPIPDLDGIGRKIYEVQLARIEQDKKKQAAQVNASAASPAVVPSKEEEDAAHKKLQDEARQIADTLLNLPRSNRLQTLFANSAEKLISFPNLLRDDQRGRLTTDFNPEERESFYALNGPTGVVTSELQQAKVLRATFSDRQLQEVMADFWFNHFNIFLNKDADQYYTTSYERDVIRAHALGKFKDLLVATATSPAMLFYLDNASSVGPNSGAGIGRPPNKKANALPPKPQQHPGLNENYGRELMELHTLGVDGGYSQADVTEAARVFTGWTIDHPEWGGGFVFDPSRHEPGDKHLLGTTIPESGQAEGMQLLDLLAHHPSTAKFICTKLAQRFISDDPSPRLVADLAQTFTDTDGDIRGVLRTLFKSKEFWSAPSYRAKVKTPLEFVVSALRASGAQVENPNVGVQTLQRMGMPLYGMQPPTGYSMKAAAWFNPDALVDRLNFSIALSTGKLGGIKVDPERLFILSVLAGPKTASAEASPPLKHAIQRKSEDAAAVPDGMQTALGLMEQALLAGDVSQQTKTTLHDQLQDAKLAGQLLDNPANSLGVITGLLLGSPEFQRR